MPAENRIFLSYQRKSSPFALNLYAELSNAGIGVWMDQFDIEPGDDWSMALQNGLDTCTALVALITPSYVESQYCTIELHRAATRANSCPIYPLMVQKIEPEDRPLEIQRIQHIDFIDFHEPGTPGYQMRLESLIKVLKKKHAAQFGEAPSTMKRYVQLLISELESHYGILDYVDLAGDTHVEDDNLGLRPNPRRKLASGLQVIANQNHQSHVTTVESFDNIHNQLQRFVLVGDPGSGKSTTLRHLARNAALAFHQNEHDNPLPLFVRLGEWQRNMSAAEFIRMQWNKHQLPVNIDVNAFFKAGKGILFLDGLDEIGREGKQKASQLQAWLKSADAPQNVVITCRKDEYDSGLTLDLPAVVVAPMQREQIEVFVGNHLGIEAENLINRIFVNDQYASLQKLAQNPYLLSALIVAHQVSPEESLPKNPGALTEVLIKALWDREQNRQKDHSIHYYDIETAFAKLAFAVIERELPNDFSRDFAIEQIGRYEFILAGQQANILTVDGDYIRFYHEMLQDYFAALRLKQVGFKTIFTPPSYTSTYRIPNKWDQSVLALAGIVKKPDQVIQDIARLDPFWAGKCLASGVQISDDVFFETIRQIVKQFDLDINILKYTQNLMEIDNVAKAKALVAKETLINIGVSCQHVLCDILMDSTVDALSKRPIAEVLSEVSDSSIDPQLLVIFADVSNEKDSIQTALTKTRQLYRLDKAVELGVRALDLIFTNKSKMMKQKISVSENFYPTTEDELAYRWIILRTLLIHNGDALAEALKLASNDADPRLRAIVNDIQS